MAKENGTKTCKYCKMEIPAGAKICPHCRKKQKGRIGKIFLFLIVLIILLSVFGDSDDNKKSSTASTSSQKSGTADKSEETITYTSYTVTEMMDDLGNNAMSAQEKYKDQYIEITGRLGVIDSDGKYISLYPTDNEYAITGVQCYIDGDEQKAQVAEMSKGDTITLRGKCTDVGEVLGYSLDIESIE